MHFPTVLASTPVKGVRVLKLNRPKELNAISTQLMSDLNNCLQLADNDHDISAIVLTGSAKAFAAGADIKEMQNKVSNQLQLTNFLAHWSDITKIRKPIVSAVRGYALGGGCELAMSTDIVYAGKNAKFGQPEIKLGVLPGAGGTQRLTRAIGKSKAMELILTGKLFTAQEAKEWGLISDVFDDDVVEEEAIKTASKMASMSQTALIAAKECVNQSFEVGLSSGILLERKLFYLMFGSKEQVDGMRKFVKGRE